MSHISHKVTTRDKVSKMTLPILSTHHSAPLELHLQVGDGVAVRALVVTLLDGLLNGPDAEECPHVRPGDDVGQTLQAAEEGRSRREQKILNSFFFTTE